jgi:hypothetical protein
MAYERYITEPIVGDPNALPATIPFSPVRQPAGWDPKLTIQPVPYRMSSTALGSTQVGSIDIKDLVKNALIAVGALAILYLVYKALLGNAKVKSNPGKVAKGRNQLVRTNKRADGTYWYRLIRKGSKPQGPFATRKSLQTELRQKGYEAVA